MMALTTPVTRWGRGSAPTLTSAPTDWDVEAKEASEVGLVISYMYRSDFYFRASIPKVKTASPDRTADLKIAVRVSPGEATLDFSSTAWGIDELLTEVNEWSGRVLAEVAKGPVARSVAEQKDAIEEVMNRLGNLERLGSDSFGKSDAAEFKRRMDDLEATISKAVAEQSRSAAETKVELEQLKRDFDELRAAVDTLNKAGVLRKFATKVLAWATTTSAPVIAKLIESKAPEIAGLLGQ